MDVCNIKTASQEHLDAIEKIEIECFDSFWNTSQLKDAINFNTCFVILVRDIVVGYLISLMAYDECEILRIAVKKNFRNNNYATCLIKNLTKCCLEKKVKHIFLEVAQTNKNAISLYEKNNFEKIGIRKKYYKNCDAIIYKMDL